MIQFVYLKLVRLYSKKQLCSIPPDTIFCVAVMAVLQQIVWSIPLKSSSTFCALHRQCQIPGSVINKIPSASPFLHTVQFHLRKW